MKAEEEAGVGGERDGDGGEGRGDVVGQVKEGGEGEEEAMDIDGGEAREETGTSVKEELEIQVCQK